MSPTRRLAPVLALLAVTVIIGCSHQAPLPAGATVPPGATVIQTSDSTKVVVNGNPSQKGYQYRFRMINPPNDNNAITEREVYLWFWPDTTRVWFRLENRTGTAIKILWNDMKFTTTDGQGFKTIHEGITFERRYDPQDFTQVYGLQRYNGWVAPVDILEDPSAAQGQGMRQLFPTTSLALGYLNRTFQVDFVLEIDNTPRTYSLVFKIDNVIPPS
ncbi:MAG TPA: hypothetical protein VKF80_00120 [Candidatus Eisenbacteria bacterium]|nr:hypothetical protein [Candidatus Eisenbacteria bacterium]